ncbi:restin homolog isoform X3 [Syngnathus scovelli]|uniref:restin homolog isoform X3 n=1 Tax=Syngnathus scovelli TaxID=161590 RepID=UPI0035CC5C37
MAMRRFFRAQRDEDFGQIHYLTAKCTHLARDKAVLDREVLLSKEREKKLQGEFQAVAAQLFNLEKTNVDLRRTQDRLLSTIHQQQELVELLQQRVIILAGESERDAQLLRQMCSELLCLQSSEIWLEGLVEELQAEAQMQRSREANSLRAKLHTEAHCGDAVKEDLHVELQIKTAELEKLRDANKMLTEELMDLRFVHEEQVRALRGENDSGSRKLQETLQQFERLCQQQRYWMVCVKSFKNSFLEEREGLLQKVRTLESSAKQFKTSCDHVSQQTQHCPLQYDSCCNRLADAICRHGTLIRRSTMRSAHNRCLHAKEL